MKKGRKNQVWSDESRKKLSEAHMGIKFSKEHLENLSKSHLGYIPTEQARINMSNAAKLGWNKRRVSEKR